MEEDQHLAKKDQNTINSKIFSVDIRKFVLITPEVDRKPIMDIAQKFGFEINSPINKDNGLFTLDAFNVSLEKFDDVVDKRNQANYEIKKHQINYYDDKKGEISIDSRLIELVSTFISNAKKDRNLDQAKIQLILNTILGDLYQADEENIKFIDEATIEQLAKANVSTTLSETKTHLNEALVDTLIQIRKLSILWFFETISLNLYNLRTDKSDTYKLQHNNEVIIKNVKYEIIPATINNQQYHLAFSEIEHTLITLDIGVKNQNLIIPLLAATFIDKASLKWRLNYSKILIKAISRLKDQTEHQIKNLSLEYDKIDLEELMLAEKEIGESFEFLYQLLFNYKNQIESENHALRRHYTVSYSKVLKNALGGAISNAVRKVTPLDLLNECDELVLELDRTVKDVSNLKFEVVSIIKELIEAKKEKNPSLFSKAVKKLQEIGENITAKTLAEIFKTVFKGQ